MLCTLSGVTKGNRLVEVSRGVQGWWLGHRWQASQSRPLESQACLPSLPLPGQSEVRFSKRVTLASRPHAENGPRSEVDHREWAVPPGWGLASHL